MSLYGTYISIMIENGLTLEQLSERTGVEPRTLRSWISEGLLSPPFKPGRGARYPSSNADRALAVRALKELHGMSLAEVGRRFMMATDVQIRDWARENLPTATSRGSARDYLRQIQEQRAPSEAPVMYSIADDSRILKKIGPKSSDPTPGVLSMQLDQVRDIDEHHAELAGIERLILALEKALDAPVPRRARGDVWTRISITPDLELSVRGDLKPRERVLFEQLADQFRTILTGRAKQ